MKLKRIFILAAAALFAVACSSDPSTELDVTVESINVPAEGGTQVFNINSNADWTVTQSAGSDWITISPSSGSKSAAVVVTVEPYDEAAGRSATITVTAGKIIKTIAVVQTRPVVPDDPSVVNVKVRAGAKDVTVEAPAGFAYKVVIPDAAKEFITLGDVTKENFILKLAANTTGEDREAVVTVCTSDDLPLQTINIKQSAKNIEAGEFLIEEIFFTKTLDETNATATGEQYIKITNTTDETLYADGLLYGKISFFSSQTSSAGAYWGHAELNDAICIENAYQIPGDGDDYAVEPGKSIVIALAAQDFSKDNANAIDLSKADFEIYEENDKYADIDNPDVPNVNVLFKSSNSLSALHDRGYESHAIFTLPANITADDFVNDYKYDAECYFFMNGSIFMTTTVLKRTSTAHYVPNEWVLDGINCGVEQYFRAGEFNVSVDAGYTGCGKIDKDENRFGKSVLRKSENGKLVDTNNSTNDFTRDATPTLKK